MMVRNRYTPMNLGGFTPQGGGAEGLSSIARSLLSEARSREAEAQREQGQKIDLAMQNFTQDVSLLNADIEPEEFARQVEAIKNKSLSGVEFPDETQQKSVLSRMNLVAKNAVNKVTDHHVSLGASRATLAVLEQINRHNAQAVDPDTSKPVYDLTQPGSAEILRGDLMVWVDDALKGMPEAQRLKNSRALYSAVDNKVSAFAQDGAKYRDNQQKAQSALVIESLNDNLVADNISVGDYREQVSAALAPLYAAQPPEMLEVAVMNQMQTGARLLVKRKIDDRDFAAAQQMLDDPDFVSTMDSTAYGGLQSMLMMARREEAEVYVENQISLVMDGQTPDDPNAARTKVLEYTGNQDLAAQAESDIARAVVFANDRGVPLSEVEQDVRNAMQELSSTDPDRAAKRNNLTDRISNRTEYEKHLKANPFQEYFRHGGDAQSPIKALEWQIEMGIAPNKVQVMAPEQVAHAVGVLNNTEVPIEEKMLAFYDLSVQPQDAPNEETQRAVIKAKQRQAIEKGMPGVLTALFPAVNDNAVSAEEGAALLGMLLATKPALDEAKEDAMTISIADEIAEYRQLYTEMGAYNDDFSALEKDILPVVGAMQHALSVQAANGVEMFDAGDLVKIFFGGKRVYDDGIVRALVSDAFDYRDARKLMRFRELIFNNLQDNLSSLSGIERQIAGFNLQAARIDGGAFWVDVGNDRFSLFIPNARSNGGTAGTLVHEISLADIKTMEFPGSHEITNIAGKPLDRRAG